MYKLNRVFPEETRLLYFYCQRQRRFLVYKLNRVFPEVTSLIFLSLAPTSVIVYHQRRRQRSVYELN